MGYSLLHRQQAAKIFSSFDSSLNLKKIDLRLDYINTVFPRIVSAETILF